MLRGGRPILTVRLPPSKETGIRLTTDGIHVPEYEAREAAVYCHYNWTVFSDLPAYEQAACIAQYRLHIAIEAHTADAYKPPPVRGGGVARRGRR